ncbi:MAG: hypothetical protein ABI919_00110 [Ramlibacter sp.]
MKKFFLIAAALLVASAGHADQALDSCIASWGKNAPFKKGARADSLLSTGVKVFGLGKGQSGGDPVTPKPALIYVQPAVNVMGATTIRLVNPRGWYCFRSNVSVAGNINIEAHCDAHIAHTRDDGTAVGAVDTTNKGVVVFGALRVTRFGCP